MDQLGVDLATGQGQVAGAEAVGPEGAVGVGLAAVHVGPGGRVDHQVGGELGHGVGHRRPAGDVEPGQVEGDQLLGVGEGDFERPPDLPPAPVTSTLTGRGPGSWRQLRSLVGDADGQEPTRA